MRLNKTNQGKDTNTEEWTIINLSMIFAFCMNKLFLYVTNSDSIMLSFIMLSFFVGIISMSVFSITYYYGKDRIQQRLKSKNNINE